MAQTKEGAIKLRARKAGVTVDELLMHEASHLKWCYKCRVFRQHSAYCSDKSRYDGLCSVCAECRLVKIRKPFVPGINPKTGRPGPAPKIYVGIDGDKVGARQQVNLEVLTGRMPAPCDLPCNTCGHLGDDKRHEYHHHLGYDSAHHLDVISLCTTCHHAEHIQTHCKRGHEWAGDNIGTTKDGSRYCRECRRAQDRKRVRPPGYWARINRNRRAK